MTSTVDSAQRGTLEPRALRRVVTALCLTEIVSYGILYYAFTVLNASIVSDTGWPLVVTTLAFSIGQVIGAVGGIAVGRIIDRHGPRVVMTAGSTLAVPALVLIALAPTSIWFVAAWSLAGVAMSAVFYTPAFSAITHWGGVRALSGLTTVTLVAGFASTVFGPLSAQLDEAIGWRGTFLVLAGVFAVLTIPTHWFGLRGEWIPSPHPIDADGPANATAPGREFVILAVALSLATLAEYGALVQLVPLLVSRGLDTSQAALVLGVGGAGQVVGRVFYRGLAAATSVVTRTVAILLLVGLTTALFPVVPAHMWLLLIVTVLAGIAVACRSVTRPRAIPDRWGASRIGRRNGLLAAPVMMTAAAAPFVAALILEWTSPTAVFLLLAVVAGVAAFLVPLTMPHRVQPLADSTTPT